MRPWTVSAVSAVAGCLLSASALAGGVQYTTVASAQPDECFNGVGQPYVPYGAGCPAGTDPKRNQTYPWSLTRFGNRVYIGTGGNVSCFGAAAVAGGGSGILSVPGLVECEGDLSQFPLVPPFLLPIMGDWRPPQVWRYDSTNGAQTQITPNDPLIALTMGIRAAGNADGVLLMGGPTVYGVGIILYAWDLYTGIYLGSWASRDYADVRKMVTVNGDLYLAVQNTYDGTGSILRWTGSYLSPFHFELVGTVDNDAAYIIEHQGRLVVGTWPPSALGSALGLGFIQDFPPAGLWVSPLIPAGGLHWYHAPFWRKVFSVDQYEPDPVITRSYLVGEPVSLGDYVIFGTMNAPGTGALALQQEYGAAINTPETQRKAYRAISIFRITGLGATETPVTDLLYGYTRLQRYDPGTGWSLVNNNLGVAPMHGGPGFGNPYNNYEWSSANAFGKAFIGTLDTGFIAQTPTAGADLYCFTDPDLPAMLVDDNGLGNPLNIGFRNMLGAPDILYVGAMNLFNLSPVGGWHLIEVLEH
jgi:hypothetical protein